MPVVTPGKWSCELTSLGLMQGEATSSPASVGAWWSSKREIPGSGAGQLDCATQAVRIERQTWSLLGDAGLSDVGAVDN